MSVRFPDMFYVRLKETRHQIIKLDIFTHFFITRKQLNKNSLSI